jgi:two-component system repressor protein LuxO
VVPIELPPLREREEDMDMLMAHFLARFNAEEGKSFTGLSPEVAALFRRYDWPGNVRQLENVIRNVVVLNQGTTITEDMLPKDLKEFANSKLVPAANQNSGKFISTATLASDVQPLWLLEKQAIMQALEHVGQDIPRAAAMLEVSPSTLYRKLQQWKSEKLEVAS